MAYEKLSTEWKVEVVVLQDNFEPRYKLDYAGTDAPLSSAQVYPWTPESWLSLRQNDQL